jgi:tetratricopeptide (TPR) repeat protein
MDKRFCYRPDDVVDILHGICQSHARNACPKSVEQARRKLKTEKGEKTMKERIVTALSMLIIAGLVGLGVWRDYTAKPGKNYSPADKAAMTSCLAEKGLAGISHLENALVGCTLVVHDGQASDADKAAAYRTRALGKLSLSTDAEGVALKSAVDDITAGIALSPADAWRYYYLRGAVAFRMDPDGTCTGTAFADFSEAIKLNPAGTDSPNSYAMRGECKAANKDYLGAAADTGIAADLDPLNEYAYRSGQAKDLLRGKAVAEVLDLWKQYAARAPGDVAVHRSYYKALLKSNQPSTAADVCTTVLEKSPAAGEWLYLRGQAYEKAGEKDKAMADYAALVELGKPTQAKSDKDEDLTDAEYETLYASRNAQRALEDLSTRGLHNRGRQ